MPPPKPLSLADNDDPDLPLDELAPVSLSQSHSCASLISNLSNFSIQYNLGVIAPALPLLPSVAAWTEGALKSSVFLGAVIGQCTMGFVCDAIGVHAAMLVTTSIAFLGIVGCILAPLCGKSGITAVLLCGRLVLGFGVGGKYPCGSAMKAEAADAEDERKKYGGMDWGVIALDEEDLPEIMSPEEKEQTAKIQKEKVNQEVARSFFWQTPGAIAPYAVALLLVVIFRGTEPSEKLNVLQYMLLVGFGAVPSVIVLLLTIPPPISWCKVTPIADKPKRVNIIPKRKNDVSKKDIKKSKKTSPSEILTLVNDPVSNPTLNESGTVASSRSNRIKLLFGTGFTWALYDIIYYGTAFNLPSIVSSILGESPDPVLDALHNVFVSSMGIPGVVCAIWAMEPMGGPKVLQSWGFISIGLCSLILGGHFTFYADSHTSPWHQYAAFAFCCALLFALNWGCNISTYVLPISMFPRKSRASYHGLSAGMGKFGGFIGGLVFTALDDMLGIGLIFFLCTLLCILGLLMTHFFIDPARQDTLFVKKNNQEVELEIQDWDGEIL
mmetsp:Transcript_30748/g.70359  ORF Transcript_30748/g.70359 Transcript_30748/m.70359 type:complete len:553 (-) Transcript_30748:384-2042(-)